MFWILLIINLVLAQPLDLSSEKTTFDSLKSYFLETNREEPQTEIKINNFYKELESQKESLFKSLKDQPLSEQPSSNFKRYERLLEVYVAFEALYHFSQEPKEKRNCDKFKHDYELSIGNDPSQRNALAPN